MNRPLLPVCVQNSWYALDAPLVVEVLGKRSWVPIPGASARSPGVISWQGRAIALVDLAGLADQPADPSVTRERTVVIRLGPATFAVPADVVREVHDVEEEALRPPRLLGKRFSSAEVELEGRLIPVLDVAELVREISHESQAGAA